MSNAPTSPYMFDNDHPEAARQLDLLGQILDRHSAQVLSRTGIRAGWRCLDIGAGAGTTTTWLAGLVAPTGRVTALDIEPRYIPAGDGIDVQQGDVRTTQLPDACYDLIHLRLVLMHLPQRERVLRRLVQALKPGGWLIVSDWDCRWTDLLVHAADPAAQSAFTAFQVTITGLAAANGADLGWASRAPLAMRDAGLTELTAVAYNEMWAGGTAGCLLHASNSRQMQPQLLRRGITEAQLDVLRHSMQQPDTLAYLYTMFSTTGRRPAR